MSARRLSNKIDFYSDFKTTICKKDIYTRKAKDRDWRSRSCFKLLEIDERFGVLKNVKRAVDLYASPGMWTQVLSRKLVMGETVYINDKCCLFYKELAIQQNAERSETPVYEIDDEVLIVAVDAYEIPIYAGVIRISGDLALYSTAERILEQFEGEKADLVVCGTLIDHTHLQFLDVNFQTNHVVLVLHIACNVLRNGGTLVAAIFKERENDMLKAQLLSLFKEVNIFRPKCSRLSAKERFIICKQYSPPDGFDPKLMEPFLDFCKKDFSSLKGINRIIIPFILCGDLNAYPLSEEDEKLLTQFTDQSSQEEEPVLPTAVLNREELEHYLEKINVAIKSLGIGSDPDDSEMETVKRMSNESGATSEEKSQDEQSFSAESSEVEEQNVYDNGPFYDLIQKTTKIKSYPPKKDDTETASGSSLQFLYEDEFTDPAEIRDCLERVGNKSPTCTCINLF